LSDTFNWDEAAAAHDKLISERAMTTHEWSRLTFDDKIRFLLGPDKIEDLLLDFYNFRILVADRRYRGIPRGYCDPTASPEREEYGIHHKDPTNTGMISGQFFSGSPTISANISGSAFKNRIFRVLQLFNTIGENKASGISDRDLDTFYALFWNTNSFADKVIENQSPAANYRKVQENVSHIANAINSYIQKR